jgi:CTP:molybdopterin cytidylyltransferase MocA
MTVGVVVVAASMEEALIDAGGRIAVRRIVDAAWAGGALPIIVVVDDDTLDDAAGGSISAALQGSPAQRVDRRGLVGAEAYAAGVRAATEAVRETSALLLWPGRMTWIDPETVTSLIEAHGRAPDRVIRPRRAGQAGWPVLLPAVLAEEVLGGAGPRSGGDSEPLGGAGVLDLEARLSLASPDTLELGDPGSVLGREVELDALPDYAGPPEPVGGLPPEWGAAAADTPDPEVPPAT